MVFDVFVVFKEAEDLSAVAEDDAKVVAFDFDAPDAAEVLVILDLDFVILDDSSHIRSHY